MAKVAKFAGSPAEQGKTKVKAGAKTKGKGGRKSPLS